MSISLWHATTYRSSRAFRDSPPFTHARVGRTEMRVHAELQVIRSISPMHSSESRNTRHRSRKFTCLHKDGFGSGLFGLANETR